MSSLHYCLESAICYLRKGWNRRGCVDGARNVVSPHDPHCKQWDIESAIQAATLPGEAGKENRNAMREALMKYCPEFHDWEFEPGRTQQDVIELFELALLDAA